ncbi:hypothetical protein ROZALSC1DRAFT_26305, partial [Rozella allomycis CSF55]
SLDEIDYDEDVGDITPEIKGNLSTTTAGQGNSVGGSLNMLAPSKSMDGLGKSTTIPNMSTSNILFFIITARELGVGLLPVLLGVFACKVAGFFSDDPFVSLDEGP